MKTVLILIVSLFFRNFYGVNPPKKKSIYQSTEKTIQSLFKFPQVLIHKNQESEIKTQKVEVLFTLDEKNKVNYANAKTNNPELKTEIEKQFKELVLQKLKSNVAYCITLCFEIL